MMIGNRGDVGSALRTGMEDGVCGPEASLENTHGVEHRPERGAGL